MKKNQIITMEDGTFRVVVALDQEVAEGKFVCELPEDTQDQILDAVVYYLQRVDGLEGLPFYNAIVNAMDSRIKDLTECLDFTKSAGQLQSPISTALSVERG